MASWIDLALAQQGKPYIWGSGSGAGGRGRQDIGADGVPRGFDCSGFVSWVLKEAVGLDLPAFTGTALPATRALAAGETPRAGDVVFYNMNTGDPRRQHIALYLGDDKIVQAGGMGNNVNVDDVRAVGTPQYRRLVTKSPEQERLLTDPQYAQYNSAGQSAGVGNQGARGSSTPINVGASAAWGAAAPYASQLISAATAHNVPLNVLAGLLVAESGGNPTAVSPKGAQGLMQFMPGTARGFGIDPFNPAQAIDAGAKYLSQLAAQSGNDWSIAVAKYNAGPAGNLNNSETQRHITKVMSFAENLTNVLPTGAGGGAGGAPPPGGGGGDGDKGDDKVPVGVKGMADLLGRIRDWGGDILSDNADTARGTRRPLVVGTQTGQQPPPGMRTDPGMIQGIQGQEDRDTAGTPRPATGSGGGATAPGAPRTKPRPQGWIDPNSVSSAVHKGIIGMSNGFLEDLQDLEDELAGLPDTPTNYLRRTQINASITALQQRIVSLAPSLRQIEQEASGDREGTVVPGVTPYTKKIPVVRKNAEGKWEVYYIDNPEAEEDPAIALAREREEGLNSRQGANDRTELELQRQRDIAAGQRQAAGDQTTLTRGRESDVAAGQRQAAGDVAAGQRQAAGDVAAGQRVERQEVGATERTNIQAVTSRVTTAMAQAVEQRRQDIDAQIRSGELTLRQATEEFNQWYKQNVEAPLAILDRQQRTAEYQLAQQRGATERATAESEHQRGIANIGQQMWGSAASAYNQMIPLTVGEGWGQGFQNNLAAGGGNYTPNQGATYNVPESLDAFATRKVAEMLAGVSPYAQNLLGAQNSMGANANPMGAQQMQGLTNTAINTAQGALNNPFQMPTIPDFSLPPPVDIAGMAGAGVENGQQLGQQINQAMPR